MNTEIQSVIQTAKVSPQAIETWLRDPIQGTEYPQRHIFTSLQKYVKDFYTFGYEPRMLGLAGLRGVGKTTLMWQLAKYTYHNLTANIYSFNVNALSSLGYSIYEVLETLQNEVLQTRFREYDKPIVFLFDEVHDDENWAKTLKILYDECRTAFVIATGSSALLINQTADLAARMKIEKIYPFEFTEFVNVKSLLDKKYQYNHPVSEEKYDRLFPPEDMANELKQGLFFSENYQDLANYVKNHIINSQEFNNYFSEMELACKKNLFDVVKDYVIYYNIPRYSLYQNVDDINASILELVKRIVYEDVARINSDYRGTDYEKLLYRLSASDEINLEKLSGLLGIPKKNIEDMLHYLNQSELINMISPYSHSIDARIVKNKKSFFMSPSIRRALLTSIYGVNIPDSAQSKMWEDIIMMYLTRVVGKSFISFCANEQGVNPDFVIDTRDCPVILEVGTNKSFTRQIASCKYPKRYGIIVNAMTKEPLFHDENEILTLPLSWFLML